MKQSKILLIIAFLISFSACEKEDVAEQMNLNAKKEHSEQVFNGIWTFNTDTLSFIEATHIVEYNRKPFMYKLKNDSIEFFDFFSSNSLNSNKLYDYELNENELILFDFYKYEKAKFIKQN